MMAEECDDISPVPRIAHDLNKKTRSSDVTVYGMDSVIGFEGLNLSDDIIKGLHKCNFQRPSPIQLRSIPLGKLGFDLLMQAKSGTGKTCVFSVLSLESVDVTKRFIQAVVVAPCREIAFQSANVIKALGHFKEGLKVKIFIGGTPMEDELHKITKCHIAVCTPGRLAHLIREFEMDLSKIRVFVLDEADRLLDQSFFTDLQLIIGALPREKQVIAASATYPDSLDEFILTFMRNPIKVQLGSACPVLLAVKQVAINVQKVMNFSFKDKSSSREDQVFQSKFHCLKEILQIIPYSQSIIFCSHQFKAEKIYESLKLNLVDVVLLSGALDQMNRLDSLLQLQQGICRLMVATDLGARGIDCENLDLVINFDCPTEMPTYVHRLGRAGRFGTPGLVVTFLGSCLDVQTIDTFQSELHLNLHTIQDKRDLNTLSQLNKNENKGHVETTDSELHDVEFYQQETYAAISYAMDLDLDKKLPVGVYAFQKIEFSIDENVDT